MKQAIGSLNPKLDGFDASCFDGVYVTGDITADDIDAPELQPRMGGEASEEDTSRLALPNHQRTERMSDKSTARQPAPQTRWRCAPPSSAASTAKTPKRCT